MTVRRRRSDRQIRSGAVVCPASRCGTSHAAGPHGDAQTGSKSLKRARKLSAQSWFSRSRLVDRLPLPVLRPGRIPDGYPRFATLSGGFERGSPVDLLLRHQRPDDTRHPVGQRHCDKHPRLARQHPGEPRIVCPATPDRPADNRHGARDQQPPKIALTHLRYPAQPRLAAGRVLARYEAEPGREVAAPLEALHRRCEGMNRHCGDRSDPRYGHNSPLIKSAPSDSLVP